MDMRGVAMDSPPHIVVVGNEKGGSGKTTLAVHVAVALLKAGQRVTTVDLDSRQRSLTHYMDNRRAWAERLGMRLEQSEHVCVDRGETPRVDWNERTELDAFQHAIARTQGRADFVVIDTPPQDSYLMRLAHLIADTLITPLNDSFLDLDVLAAVDPVTFEVAGTSHYAEMVRSARRKRRAADGCDFDWVVLRNRLAVLGSRHKRCIGDDLVDLSRRINFRVLDGMAERVAYRQLFPRGLTALDHPAELRRAGDVSISTSAAGREIMRLIQSLHLPLDHRREQRAAAQLVWMQAHDSPLVPDDLLAAEMVSSPR
ncbi:MAG TPA: division plane positioning ATPase MipZ [Pseudolabrys sp.]|nr:division plane positioning ATPase MipZ [Pseudolabrys sp.]